MPVLLQKNFFFLQPALRRDLVKLRIHLLGPADASGKSNHAGNMNADRTITTATKNTVPPNDPLDLHQKMTVHLAPLLIQSPQGLDGLVGGHIFRIFIVGHIEETAFCAEAAMGTMGQISFHLAFLLIEHFFNLFRINRLCFLVHFRFPFFRGLGITRFEFPGQNCIRCRSRNGKGRRRAYAPVS